MKNLALIGCFAAMFALCSSTTNNNKQWEYKVVKVNGQESEKEDKEPLIFNDQAQMLNKMGKDGWELVNTYTEDETVYPKYGGYARENHRTKAVNFVFKRQLDL